MADYQTTDHVLILLWDDESAFDLGSLRREFAGLEISYCKVALPTKGVRLESDGISSVPAELLQKATIIVTATAIPQDIGQVPNLKWLHLFSAGVDHLSNHPIVGNPSSEVLVTTSSGIHATPMAEWVLMATLVLTKDYHTNYNYQKAGIWGSNANLLRNGFDWAGKKVGIAGYGSIGRQIANIFHALGSDIYAFTASPRETPESRVDHGFRVTGGDPSGTIPVHWSSGLGQTDFHAFLDQGLDLLILCLPLTPQSRNIMGEAEFAMLGRDCIIVNIGRAQLLDQDALMTALNSGSIRGAALDVTDPEPLPADHLLWKAQNCIIAPHLSSVGREYVPRCFDVLKVSLRRWQKEERLLNLVSKAKGY